MAEKSNTFESSVENQSDSKNSGTKSTRVRKILWVIALLIVTVGFLCHVGVQLEIFLKYQVAQVKDNEQQALFPDVVICQPTYFGTYRSKTYKLNSSINYKTDIFPNILTKTWNVITNNNYTTASTKVKEALDFAKLTFLPELAHFEVGSTPADVITACHYDGTPCDYRNFTAFLNSDYGLCILFQPRQKELQPFQEGMERGLSLNLLIESNLKPLDESRLFTTFVEGYSIFIQSPGTWPLLQNPDVIGQSERQVTISFKQSQLIQLNRPGFACTSTVQRKLCRIEYKVGLKCRIYNISQANERLILFQEHLSNQCKCITYEWPIPENLKHMPSCHYIDNKVYLSKSFNASTKMVTMLSGGDTPLDSLLNMYAAGKQIQCYKGVKYKFNKGNKFQISDVANTESKKWIRPCEENKYSIDIGDFMNPFASGGTSFTAGMSTADLYIDEINRLLKVVNGSNGQMTSILQSELNSRGIRLKQEGLHLNIYAEKAERDVRKEILVYDLGKFFADLGGLSGVWIGISALSLLTFLDNIILQICRCRKNRDGWTLKTDT